MRCALPRSIAIVLVVLTAACASSGASAAGPSGGGSRSVITETDLAAAGTESAYDVVQRLRPEYLRAKPAQSGSLSTGVVDAPPPTLIVNGQHTGEVSDLRHIPAVSLSQIRYYNIEEAKRKFGMQYMGGAIELTYKTR